MSFVVTSLREGLNVSQHQTSPSESIKSTSRALAVEQELEKEDVAKLRQTLVHLKVCREFLVRI